MIITKKLLQATLACSALLLGACADNNAEQTTTAGNKSQNQAQTGDRVKYSFNPDWKFIKANPIDAHKVDFDDSQWQSVNTPHTFNDIDTFDEYSVGKHKGEINQWRGTVWYRKHFKLPADQHNKKVFIEFESVRQVADVYLNGVHLGKNQTGFIPFGYDLTPYLNKDGANNVLAVKVNNERGEHFRDNFPLVWNHEHWHPTHGGIYRNVYLHTMNPVHITLPLYDNLKTLGTYVYTENVSEKNADVSVQAQVKNNLKSAESVEVVAEIVDNDGKVVETLSTTSNLAAGAMINFEVSGKVANPKLWSTRYPYLYTVVTKVKIAGKVVDSYNTPLGIRDFEFNKDTGFWLNGENIKLTGWGQKPTGAWAGLGAAMPDWMREYTFRLMDEAGGNFIRWGHAAGAPAEVAMGDKYGFVTLMPGVAGESSDSGETWDIRYAAFKDTLVYYRNHPSIFIWEGGNWGETHANYKDILAAIAEFDPKGNRLMGNRRADVKLASKDYVTIEVGTEGWEREYAHLPIIESEYNRDEGPRRVWDKYSPDNNFYSSPRFKNNVYKFASESFAVRQVEHWWQKMGKKPYHSGGANWIFSDGPHGGRNPTENTRASGEVDAVRLPKEAFYTTKAMWRPEPQAHIVGHWNYEPGTVKDMYVVANGQEVKLYVNDKLIGSNDKPENGFTFKFPQVKFAAGSIKAETYVDGKLTASQVKQTIGQPVALKLTPITGPDGWLANGADYLLVDFEAVDALGRRHPLDQSMVTFKVEGPAVWRGGYNSGKEKSTNNLYLETESGINRVAIRSTLQAGKVTITASREGFADVSVTVASKPINIENGLTTKLPQTYAQDLRLDPKPLYMPPQPPLPINSEAKSALFTNFSYTGLQKAVLRTNAFWGKKPYIDQEVNYTVIPSYLNGAEYIRLPNADKAYWARDQLQFIAGEDMTVWVGHDDLVPRPAFLADYTDTGDDFKLGENTMSLFARKVKAGDSVIMAGNADGDIPDNARMYVVLAKADKDKR
ncbi:glycoside hydrolase family 2 protein [Catenovulum agarivorans]|uniref:glycoside hydrolase family 2 protein n=1 Tax=Catenovulum agarivorans TaxID=1172192 RepID=UPI0002ECCFBF|nr:sugar-binding domain-containing protein [Catenovulum agarivorans]